MCQALSMSLCLPRGSDNGHGSCHAIQTHERAGEFRGGDAINSHARRTPSMKAIWRRHLIICLFLGLLAIPIYWLDQVALRPSGDNWITLDFRGLSFWTYIIFIAIHVTLSSIAILLFPGSGMLRVHFGSMVVSLILLVTGFVVYGKLLQLQLMMDAYEMRTRTDTAICAATCPNSNRLCSLTDWLERSAVPVRHCGFVLWRICLLQLRADFL